jgi:3',5'-cyclic-AMP phosphodiesterase
MRTDAPFLDPDSLTTPFAHLPDPRTDGETVRIALLSDTHVAVDGEATPRKAFHRTGELLERAVEDANGRDVDRIVLAGDLTKDGHPDEFALFEERVEGADAPMLAVPGNHDVPKETDDHETPPLSRFARRYAPELPFSHRVGPLTLIGLNSAETPEGTLSGVHHGQVSADQLAWLDGALDRAAVPLVVVHHNPLSLPQVVDRATEWPWHVYRHADPMPFLSLLRGHGVPLVIAGHQHVPSLRYENGLVQVIAPALASYPLSYLLVEIGPSGTTLTLVPVATSEGLRETYENATGGEAHHQAMLSFTEQTLRSLPF